MLILLTFALCFSAIIAMGAHLQHRVRWWAELSPLLVFVGFALLAEVAGIVFETACLSNDPLMTAFSVFFVIVCFFAVGAVIGRVVRLFTKITSVGTRVFCLIFPTLLVLLLTLGFISAGR